MKTELLKISQDLEQGTITDNEARTLLLGLLGVVAMLPSDDEIEEAAKEEADRLHQFGDDTE